jgi:hypothetical protein
LGASLEAFFLELFVIDAPYVLAIAWLLWHVGHGERSLIRYSNRLDGDKGPRAADGEMYDSND